MPSNQITVVVPTCSRPSHPSTRILDETIASVRASLPDSPLLITCDGPRPELDRSQLMKYAGFCEAIQGRYENAKVTVFEKRGHQTGNLEAILPEIKTPLLMFCEDDWKILPNIQWDRLSELILRGTYNYVKLYPQPRVSPWHEHMMRERDHHEFGSEHVFCIRTVQFSANPHLASTEWYRELYRRHLSNKVEFIEEVLHGLIGQAAWDEYKLAIYNPDAGDMYRCAHLDGKGNTE